MNPFATAIVVLVSLSMANQALTRFDGMWRRRPIYLAMQTANVVTGAFVIFAGLPGFENNRMATVLVGLMFLFRAYWNYRHVANAEWEARQEDWAHQREQLRQLVEARSEDEDESAHREEGER